MLGCRFSFRSGLLGLLAMVNPLQGQAEQRPTSPAEFQVSLEQLGPTGMYSLFFSWVASEDGERLYRIYLLTSVGAEVSITSKDGTEEVPSLSGIRAQLGIGFTKSMGEKVEVSVIPATALHPFPLEFGVVAEISSDNGSKIQSEIVSKELRIVTPPYYDTNGNEVRGVLVPEGTPIVDDDDLTAFLDHFGTKIFESSSYAVEADFNGNGTIDFEDFFILVDNYGKRFVY